MRHILILPLLLATTLAAAPPGPRDYLKKPSGWFSTPEAAAVAANILSWQADTGAWPKNVDTTVPYAGDRASLKGTFDNHATTDELRFLARIYNATQNPPYKSAFLKGFDLILKAQYPTGGWPQSYPPGKGYARHITFNDDAMVRLMLFLRETCADPAYAFLDQPRQLAAKAAFDRGIDCILKCQIKVDGKLTVWCAQHDELDYSPRPARTFELASLSGAESVGIVRLLMSLDHPSPQIIQSVESAIAWFESSQLKGIKVIEVPDAAAPRGKDKRIVPDKDAPPLWARFYDINTNRPIFADRDGIPKANLSDIGYERRNGYAWLGAWPTTLLQHEYTAWRLRHGKTRAR